MAVLHEFEIKRTFAQKEDDEKTESYRETLLCFAGEAKQRFSITFGFYIVLLLSEGAFDFKLVQHCHELRESHSGRVTLPLKPASDGCKAKQIGRASCR